MAAHAQVATWMVRPTMDKIEFDAGNKVFVCQKDDSTFVWNTDGKQIIATNHRITPFRNGITLHLRAEDNGLYGFTQLDGTYHSMTKGGEDPLYTADGEQPCFSHGFLLIRRIDDGLFYYVNRKGEVKGEGYVCAYPFSNGQASVRNHKDAEKRNGNPIAKLINSRFEEILMTRNGKPVKPGTFDFISSVGDGKQAICIDGKAVYVYDSKTDDCTRYSTDNSSDKKTFVQLSDKEFALPPADKAFEVATDKGIMYFDSKNILVKTAWGWSKRETHQKAPEIPVYMKAFTDKSLVGLNWSQGGMYNCVLPAQFKEVQDMYENLAIVRIGDLFGILSVNNNQNIKAELNAGNPLEFSHSTCQSSIELVFPFRLSASDIQDFRSTGPLLCKINQADVSEDISTTSCKFTYPCTPAIPSAMSPGEKAVGTYEFTVRYDELTSVPVTVSADASYTADYEVSLSTPSLMKDTVSFAMDMVSGKAPLASYKADITTTNSMSFNIEATGPCSFAVKLFGLPAGDTPFSLVVSEDGCPSTSTPCVVSYTPGQGKKKGAASVEKVVENESLSANLSEQ